jgi:hypothetical protein
MATAVQLIPHEPSAPGTDRYVVVAGADLTSLNGAHQGNIIPGADG